MRHSEAVFIVGAGPVGCYNALAYAQLGFSVTLIERRTRAELLDQRAGASFNIALSARGLYALDRIEHRAQTLARAAPIIGRRIHGLDGEYEDINYSGNPSDRIWSIKRYEFLAILLENISQQSEHIIAHFGAHLESVEILSNRAVFIDCSGRVQDVRFDLLLACDGVNSTVGQCLDNRLGCDSTLDVLKIRYREIDLLQDAGFSANDRLHIWPRTSTTVMGFPNVDGTLTGILFDNINAAPASSLQDQIESMNVLKPAEVKRIVHAPTKPIKCISRVTWCCNDTILLGDAAHAMPPFYGQGLNCSLENSAILVELIADRKDQPINQLLCSFSHNRRPDVAAIQELSFQNYRELEVFGASASKAFSDQSQHFHRVNHEASIYQRVTFSREPYAHIMDDVAGL